jgi:hypothetical protein
MRRLFVASFLCMATIASPMAHAQSVTGEASVEDFVQAWRLAAASLAAAASVPVTATAPATRADAVKKFADYHARLNEAVIALVRMRPPADPILMRRHFALLPLFQEATAAGSAWLKEMRGADEQQARLAEEWFQDTATRLRERARALEK